MTLYGEDTEPNEAARRRAAIENAIVAWLDAADLTTLKIFGEWYVEVKDRRYSISDLAEHIGVLNA